MMRASRRRIPTTMKSPCARWTFISRQRYDRSALSVRSVASLTCSLIAASITIFIIVFVLPRFRDNVHGVDTASGVAAPAETDSSTSQRLFSRCGNREFVNTSKVNNTAPKSVENQDKFDLEKILNAILSWKSPIPIQGRRSCGLGVLTPENM